MKRIIALLFVLAIGCQDNEMIPDIDNVVVGRIIRKSKWHRFEREEIALILSNGKSGCMGSEIVHYCYVSEEEYDKRKVGEIYACSYK